MADLGWKFYFINASWVVVFFLVIYFTWVETNGLTLEEIGLKFEGEIALQGEPLEEQVSARGSNIENGANEIKKSDGVVVSTR